MQILSIQPTFSFTSKNQAVNNVLKQFDKDMLTYKTKSVSVKKQRLALEKLMQGFDVTFLMDALNLTKHKIYYLSTKYNARKVYMQNREDIILKRLLNGERRKKIAKEMCINTTTVQDVAEKYNTYTVYKTYRDNLIKEKYVAGMKLVDIAAMLKVDPETVSRVLKKMGVKKS